jgi:hypothetical protein
LIRNNFESDKDGTVDSRKEESDKKKRTNPNPKQQKHGGR